MHQYTAPPAVQQCDHPRHPGLASQRCSSCMPPLFARCLCPAVCRKGGRAARLGQHPAPSGAVARTSTAVHAPPPPLWPPAAANVDGRTREKLVRAFYPWHPRTDKLIAQARVCVSGRCWAAAGSKQYPAAPCQRLALEAVPALPAPYPSRSRLHLCSATGATSLWWPRPSPRPPCPRCVCGVGAGAAFRQARGCCRRGAHLPPAATYTPLLGRHAAPGASNPPVAGSPVWRSALCAACGERTPQVGAGRGDGMALGALRTAGSTAQRSTARRTPGHELIQPTLCNGPRTRRRGYADETYIQVAPRHPQAATLAAPRAAAGLLPSGSPVPAGVPLSVSEGLTEASPQQMAQPAAKHRPPANTAMPEAQPASATPAAAAGERAPRTPVQAAPLVIV